MSPPNCKSPSTHYVTQLTSPPKVDRRYSSLHRDRHGAARELSTPPLLSPSPTAAKQRAHQTQTYNEINDIIDSIRLPLITPPRQTIYILHASLDTISNSHMSQLPPAEEAEGTSRFEHCWKNASVVQTQHRDQLHEVYRKPRCLLSCPPCKIPRHYYELRAGLRTGTLQKPRIYTKIK